MVSSNRAEEIVLDLAESTERGAALRRTAMRALSRLEGYNWCGIYRLDPDGLRLDEFIGAATDHILIPVGRGVCGAAVAENRNQIVKDVRKLENYLACSIQTKSEIVVLIRDRDGSVLGQIDIDGHEVGSFDESDEQLLDRIGKLLAERWA